MAAAVRKELERLRHVVDALGGTRLFAVECGVSTWSVRAWLSGEHTPSPENQRRIDILANDVGLPSPYPGRSSGVRRKPREPRDGG